MGAQSGLVTDIRHLVFNIFFDKRDLSFVCAIILKPKIHWFPNEGCYCAGKLSTDINLVPLIPDEDKTFSGSLVLNLRI